MSRDTHTSLGKRSAVALAIGFGIVGALLGRHVPFARDIEARSYDWRITHLAPAKDKPGAALILIDEPSIAFMKELDGIAWPFPRDLYCPLLAFLAEGGARAVAFDVLYPEPDEFDPSFAECLIDAPRPILSASCEGPEGAALPAHWGRDVRVSDDAAVVGPGCEPLVPVPELATATHGAHIEMTPDSDGVMRRVPLVRLAPMADGATRALPVLGLEAYLQTFDDPPPLTRTARGLQIGRGPDALHVPLTDEGAMLVPWLVEDPPVATFSFKQVFANGELLLQGGEPALNPAVFENKVVFIGASAAGTYDLRVTPIAEADFGVHLHVSTFEGLRQRRMWRPAPAWLDLLVALAALLAVALLSTWPRRVSAQILSSTGTIAVVVIGVLLAFRYGGLWVDSVTAMGGMAGALLGGTLLNYLTEGRERREIRRAFQHYVPPEVVDEVVADPSKLQLGGSRREITAFFSDIEGFTTISERMEPTALVAFLNEFLTEMSDIVQEEGGTIDKYIGDAIVGIFGAPLDQPDHAERACRAALRCQARLTELRPKWRAAGLPPAKMRIGLNSGVAVVGNMGSKRRFEYTMIGDTVNLAARLEGSNKAYGTYILVGERTAELAHERVAMRQLDLLQVKGKQHAVRVFEPTGLVVDEEDAVGFGDHDIAATLGAFDEKPAQRRLRERFEAALALWQAGDFADARVAFEGIAVDFPDDTPTQVFLGRLDALRDTPPPGWDGVFKMTTK